MSSDWGFVELGRHVLPDLLSRGTGGGVAHDLTRSRHRGTCSSRRSGRTPGADGTRPPLVEVEVMDTDRLHRERAGIRRHRDDLEAGQVGQCPEFLGGPAGKVDVRSRLPRFIIYGELEQESAPRVQDRMAGPQDRSEVPLAVMHPAEVGIDDVDARQGAEVGPEGARDREVGQAATAEPGEHPRRDVDGMCLAKQVTEVLSHPAAAAAPFEDRLPAIIRTSLDQTQGVLPAGPIIVLRRARSRDPERMVVATRPVPAWRLCSKPPCVASLPVVIDPDLGLPRSGWPRSRGPIEAIIRDWHHRPQRGSAR